jgi:arsenate reductase
MRDSNKRKTLFLCTGNSCRSQMAEAIVNNRMENEWQAFSAGTKPAGYIHPKAIKVLEEINIKHDGISKHVDEFTEVEFDLVVTVCDSAAEECPVWLGKGRRVHKSYPDPAKAIGSEEEIMESFRSVRDDILVDIPHLLSDYEAKLSLEQSG